MNLEGARLARAAADEWRHDGSFVAGSVGPLNVSLSLSPEVDDPAYRAATFDEVVETYAEQIRALRDGGVDLLLIETVFDTLNAKAAIVAAQDAAPELPLWLSFTAVDKQRPQPLRPDGRGVLDLGRARAAARRRRQLLARRDRDASVRRGSRGDRADVGRVPPERGPAERARRARRAAGGHEPLPRRVRARRPRQHRRRLLRHDAGARPADRGRGRRGRAARGSASRAPRTRFSGLEPFGAPHDADSNFTLIGERTNVTGSARFRRLVEGGRLPGGARRRARAGARRREPPRREHGRRPARRRAGDDDLPQPRRDRARGRADPDHGRQLALVGARGRAQVHPGQGRRQLALAEGGRGGVPRARARGSPLRRRRRRDGVRRGGPGRHRRAQGRDLRARLPAAHRGGRLRAGGHDLRPERPRRRDRHRGAPRLREGVPRGAAADQGELPGREDERRDLEPQLRVPRQRRRARGDALGVPLPRDPRRPRHGHRQRGPARGLRGHRAGAARARRGRHLRPARRRDRAARRVRRAA